MKIIRFDPKPTVEEEVDANHRLFMSDTNFACPHCKAKSKASFSGMIFRVMEFYCKSCGAFFKISNPGFGAPRKKQ